MTQLDSLVGRLNNITIDSSPGLTKERFNEMYGYPGLPVLFTQAFRELPIREKWTPGYLMNALPEKEAVEDSAGNGRMLYQNLEDYLREGPAGYYYKTSRHCEGALSGDWVPLDLFDCWYAGTKAGTPRGRLSWLYVGKTGSQSELHRDIWWTSAWNYLVSGLKVWFIYPPVYNDFIKEDMDAFCVKKILENPDAAAEMTYRPLICVQRPGDLIFIPGHYYHGVYNIADSISLTENFVNETNYDLVRTWFRSRGNRKNINSIEAIVKEGFSNNAFTTKTYGHGHEN
ncbi:MAG: cupin-like domain-containing protein [Bacteroidetes bacterium]|nr:cupin-like domain-containing protein [Bacteroidota bacterium]